MNFKVFVKGGPPLYYVKFNTKANAPSLVRNSNCVKTTVKEVFELKRYLIKHGHLKIMPNCLGSVEEVPGYMCYRFQHFISKRAITRKITHKHRIRFQHFVSKRAAT